MPAARELKEEVMMTRSCALCGACMGWCPYIKNLDDHLTMAFDCIITEGRCYNVCPRTFTDWPALYEKYVSASITSPELGNYIRIVKVQAVNPVAGSQDGGTVTALLQTLIEEKDRIAAVLTGSNERYEPSPLVAHDLQAIKESAGSRFLASPGLGKIIEALQSGAEQVAVVGRPCQMQGLRKIQALQEKRGTPAANILGIGLFCMWSLDWSFYEDFYRSHPGIEIKSMRIPQHHAILETSEGRLEIPVDQIKSYTRNGCSYCLDLSSELADLSVGAFEAVPGWNTLIIRTEAGEQLVNCALGKGYLDIEEYPEAELARLKAAALSKKVKTLATLEQRFASGEIKPFIDLDHPFYQAALEMMTKEETN